MSDDSSIPREYFSEYEDRPFSTCTRCGESLEDAPDGYQVAKHWHNGEVTYEFALCHPCHAGILAEFSKESRERLEKFHREQFHTDRGSERCAICGMLDGTSPRAEFTRTGLFSGQRLAHEFLVCGLCMRSMQELMSEHTRGVWERFVAENFPTAPADTAPDPAFVLNV